MSGGLDGLLDGDVRTLVAAVHDGAADPVEVAEAATRRAASAPADALVAADPEVATAAARALADRLAAGERPPLAGVPVAHKDLFDTADFPTSYGNPALSHRPDRDATAVARTVAAGALQVGKAALHEVAYGVTGVNPWTGTPRNPRDPARMPGGSSSGSGALVAAGTVGLSLGSDTGGSVRIPAACCGVVGLKTTRGAVPTTGVLPLSTMQDTVGPLARTAADAALLLRVVAGPDGDDPVCVPPPDDWDPTALRPDLAGVAVLVPTDLWERRVRPDVHDACAAAVGVLEAAGGEVREVALPGVEDVRRAQATVLAAHALAVHGARLDREPGTFGDDIRRRLEDARRIGGADLARALDVRRRWIHDVGRILADASAAGAVIATPTLTFAPPHLETEKISWDDGEEDVTPALTRLTGIWNLAGLPAVAVPVGEVAPGVPGSLQMIGARWAEPLLLSAAAVVERGG